MVSTGTHRIRVWDVRADGRVINPETPKWETIAQRSGGEHSELAETHASFAGNTEILVVKFDSGYYVTMAAEIKLAGYADWTFHTIREVRHERQAGLTVLTLEISEGTPGYTEGAFSDGFSDGFA